jgi:hypothetical protein
MEPGMPPPYHRRNRMVARALLISTSALAAALSAVIAVAFWAYDKRRT